MSRQMRVDGGIRILEEAHRNWICLVFGAANTHEVANTPFNDVRVQEHRYILVSVRWVGLQHSDTLVGSVDHESFELMRNHVVFFIECFESGGECVFVAPACPSLGYQCIVMLGSVVIVVRC